MFTDKLIQLMQSDIKVCVLTGAGVSAESGVPTFRGEHGLWKKFRPEELANVDAFLNNPELVLAWYQHRRDLIDNIEPNPGHYSLAKMEQHYTDFTLVTQNVDGLHRRAGSRRTSTNCTVTYCVTNASNAGQQIERVDFVEGEELPRCQCGGMIRPDVVWFGEMLPEKAIGDAVEKSSEAELFFSIGTSAIVYPAAALPLTAQRSGAYLVEINVEKTELSRTADEVLLGPSGEILPKLLEKAG